MFCHDSEIGLSLIVAIRSAKERSFAERKGGSERPDTQHVT
jgi:hypothetical protein